MRLAACDIIQLKNVRVICQSVMEGTGLHMNAKCAEKDKTLFYCTLN